MTFSLQQPHHILQKRLLEAKLSRGQVCGMTPNKGGVLLSRAHLKSHDKEEEEEEDDLIYVPCKVSWLKMCRLLSLLYLHQSCSPSSCCQCLGREVKVLIDSGCRLNLMSSLTVDRLG